MLNINVVEIRTAESLESSQIFELDVMKSIGKYYKIIQHWYEEFVLCLLESVRESKKLFKLKDIYHLVRYKVKIYHYDILDRIKGKS